MAMIVLGLLVATALVLAFVLISPHRRRRGARDEGCAYAGDGGWNPAFASGDSNGADCGAGDGAGGGGCDGGGGGGGD